MVCELGGEHVCDKCFEGNTCTYCKKSTCHKHITTIDAEEVCFDCCFTCDLCEEVGYNDDSVQCIGCENVVCNKCISLTESGDFCDTCFHRRKFYTAVKERCRRKEERAKLEGDK